MIQFIKKFINLFRTFEKAMLVFFLSLILIISFTQIILRLFLTGIEWFDSLLKYSVLWAGMIAAGIATYEDKHIKIDIIGRFTRGRLKLIVKSITNLFAGIICLVLFISFIVYIAKIEFPSTDMPPFLNIKRWTLLLILPISFCLMSIRFFIHTYNAIRKYVLKIDEPEQILPHIYKEDNK